MATVNAKDAGSMSGAAAGKRSLEAPLPKVFRIEEVFAPVENASATAPNGFVLQQPAAAVSRVYKARAGEVVLMTGVIRNFADFALLCLYENGLAVLFGNIGLLVANPELERLASTGHLLHHSVVVDRAVEVTAAEVPAALAAYKGWEASTPRWFRVTEATTFVDAGVPSELEQMAVAPRDIELPALEELAVGGKGHRLVHPGCEFAMVALAPARPADGRRPHSVPVAMLAVRGKAPMRLSEAVAHEERSGERVLTYVNAELNYYHPHTWDSILFSQVEAARRAHKVLVAACVLLVQAPPEAAYAAKVLVQDQGLLATVPERSRVAVIMHAHEPPPAAGAAEAAGAVAPTGPLVAGRVRVERFGPVLSELGFAFPVCLAADCDGEVAEDAVELPVRAGGGAVAGCKVCNRQVAVEAAKEHGVGFAVAVRTAAAGGVPARAGVALVCREEVAAALGLKVEGDWTGGNLGARLVELRTLVQEAEPAEVELVPFSATMMVVRLP